MRGGSNSCKPVVVFASRTIKDAEAYQAAYAKYAEEAQTGSGVRAMFSFLSTEEANTALQFTWYDSPADLVKQPVAVMSCYAGSEATDYCQIWGGWDEEFKAGLSQPGCKFGFVKTMRGFLRDPGTGFDTGSPPMIWISKRNVQVIALACFSLLRLASACFGLLRLASVCSGLLRMASDCFGLLRIASDSDCFGFGLLRTAADCFTVD